MKSLKNILCVDDDLEIRNIIRASLPSEITFGEADTLPSAIGQIESENFEIILLDLNLCGESGYKLVEYIKEKEFSIVPKIIIITGSDKEDDEIRGHQLEVTEFVRKPIRPSAFRALVEKHLLKSYVPKALKKFGPLKVDPIKMQVRMTTGSKEDDLLLTLKEYKLLMKFMDHPGVSFTREQLYVDVWDSSSEIQSRTIDMHVSALRKKLGSFGASIASVRGVGYLFDPEKMIVS